MPREQEGFGSQGGWVRWAVKGNGSGWGWKESKWLQDGLWWGGRIDGGVKGGGTVGLGWGDMHSSICCGGWAWVLAGSVLIPSSTSWGWKLVLGLHRPHVMHYGAGTWCWAAQIPNSTLWGRHLVLTHGAAR